jgi:benzodiazapine receptor
VEAFLGFSGYGPLLVAGAIAVGTLAAGALLTDIGPWYRGLRKPSWQPPDWLFGPAWTAIFACATWAAVLAWSHASSPAHRAVIVGLFGLNCVLNVAWSVLFFRWRRPDWALLEVVALWLSIVALMVALWPLTSLGVWLMTPYLAWVSFASYLNRTIVRLNGAFAS